MLLETKVTQLCGLYLPARVITQCWQPVTVQSAPRALLRQQTAAEIATQNAKAQLAEEQVQNVVLQTNLNEDGSQMTVYAI